MAVALVGIIGVVLSGLFGASISGFITYKTTNRQVQVRLDELHQQLQHEREEAQKGRLIEARKSYLLPLRTGISDCYGACSTLLINTMLIKDLKEGGLPTDAQVHLQNAMDQVKAAGEILTSFPRVINPLIGQIADPNLVELVTPYTHSLHAISAQITGMLIAVQNGIESNTLEPLMNEILESVSKIIPEKVLPVNRRIEELLSGD